MKGIQEVLSGVGADVFIIAEVGQAHEGSLGQAMAFIDAAADAGADAVKFQTHFAEHESSRFDNFRVNVFPQDKTRFDYWKRMEFSSKEWQLLSNKALERGLVFLSSPFSVHAVEVLTECNVSAWKIASGELNNLPMLEKINQSGKPVLISTGLASWADIASVCTVLEACPKVIFQCTTEYPSRPETLGFNNLDLIGQNFPGVGIGFSDHSGELYPCIGACALGARFFEVHITWSKIMFGPDTSSSLTIEQFASLTKSLRNMSKALSSPVDKDRVQEEKNDLIELFGRGIYSSKALMKGHKLRLEDLSFLKPNMGLGADKYPVLLGKILKTDVPKGGVILDGDIE